MSKRFSLQKELTLSISNSLLIRIIVRCEQKFRINKRKLKKLIIYMNLQQCWTLKHIILLEESFVLC